MEETKTTGKRFVNLLGTAFLSLLLPGLGHLSCGKVRKALIVYVISQVTIIAAFFVFIKIALPYNLILSVTMFASVYLYAIIDSILLAKKPGNTLKLKPILGYSILVAVIRGFGVRLTFLPFRYLVGEPTGSGLGESLGVASPNFKK